MISVIILSCSGRDPWRGWAVSARLHGGGVLWPGGGRHLRLGNQCRRSCSRRLPLRCTLQLQAIEEGRAANLLFPSKGFFADII
jgi:hypothetical protein